MEFNPIHRVLIELSLRSICISDNIRWCQESTLDSGVSGVDTSDKLDRVDDDIASLISEIKSIQVFILELFFDNEYRITGKCLKYICFVYLMMTLLAFH